MTNGWDGADPSPQSDGASVTYELATRYTANANITITGIRVWASQTQNVANRNARLWTIGGSLQRTIDIDDSLPTTGWTEYELATTYDVASGSSVDVSYSTTNYYGAISGGYPNNSSDGNVTATEGRFAESHGTFPSTATGTFYGIDIVYILQGGNQPPEITGVTIQKSDLAIIATATVEDETPSTVTLEWDWGDGSSTSTGAGVLSASHTYSASGLYGVLVTATDNGALKHSFAAAVQIIAPATATSNEEWIDDILDAVVSDVQRSGYFDKVNKHEPKKAPDTGLTAAVWFLGLDPIPLNSGLASTSARITYIIRLYSKMLQEPQDMIDPRMTKATANLMRRYHDDFDFEGLIRNVDLLGQFGLALSAVSGYLDIDGKMFRIIDITVPCIVNDVWPQAS